MDIPYTTSASNQNLVLKIGRADQYVHGQQTYVITYDQDNVTDKADGYDGLFWDVNGDQWPQGFGEVTARIHVDPSLATARDTSHDRCFTGNTGSTLQNCTVHTDGSAVVASTNGGLNAGQTLTFELGFKPGTFAGYTVPKDYILGLATKILFFTLLPIAITAWFTIRRWWRYGRDPVGRGVIIAEYTPPKDLTVLSSSSILNEGFKTSAVTATILDLAVRGYLKVYEVKTPVPVLPDKISYELELIKSSADLKSDEQTVVTMLFGGDTPGTRVDISSLKNKLYLEAGRLGKAVDQSVVDAGYFTVAPSKAKAGFAAGGIILIAVSVLLTRGNYFLLAGLAGSGMLMLAIAQIMPARTAKGVAVHENLLGLKLFISMTETDRIEAMQSPHGKLTEKIDTGDKKQLIKLYEKLLPYAMLFGVEKAWIKEFAGLYDAQPDWYSGSGAFNAGYFAGSLSSFSAASNAGFTAPSSSGGGGSAGGGGGGGGGGGW